MLEYTILCINDEPKQIRLFLPPLKGAILGVFNAKKRAKECQKT